ncbi:MAG: hypothetical protein H7Y32_13820, partial [Chloroflexales bacterium]|nr:hypothetical protein [Chloroflexales bacterium]
ADGEPPESAPGALLLSAPQSGRFDLRRPDGWSDLAVYRLLIDGRLAKAPYSVEDTHLVVPYVAEDELGPTDAYLVAAPDAPLPARLHAYLATLLRAKEHTLRQAAVTILAANTAAVWEAGCLQSAANMLQFCAEKPAVVLAYQQFFEAVAKAVTPVAERLAAQLTALRAAHAAGLAYDAALETTLEGALEALILARMGGG